MGISVVQSLFLTFDSEWMNGYFCRAEFNLYRTRKQYYKTIFAVIELP